MISNSGNFYNCLNNTYDTIWLELQYISKLNEVGIVSKHSLIIYEIHIIKRTYV